MSQKINPNFWENDDPKVIASALLGRSIIIGDVEVTVLETEAFTRASNDGRQYKPILSTPSGHMYCAPIRQYPLLLIACNDHGQTGACVRVTKVEQNGAVYSGPKAIGDLLGLQRKMGGRTKWADEWSLHIVPDGMPEPREAKPAKNSCANVTNGIGKQTLEAEMPRIIAKYMSEQSGCTLVQFINNLLQICGSVSEFRKALTS